MTGKRPFYIAKDAVVEGGLSPRHMPESIRRFGLTIFFDRIRIVVLVRSDYTTDDTRALR